jgi:hypothetical protein
LPTSLFFFNTKKTKHSKEIIIIATISCTLAPDKAIKIKIMDKIPVMKEKNDFLDTLSILINNKQL